MHRFRSTYPARQGWPSWAHTLKVGASNDDFPALLAEALDVLAALDADPKPAAAVLRCTPSQLVRLLKLDPRALALVNRWRRDRQMHPLQQEGRSV